MHLLLDVCSLFQLEVKSGMFLQTLVFKQISVIFFSTVFFYWMEQNNIYTHTLTHNSILHFGNKYWDKAIS